MQSANSGSSVHLRGDRTISRLFDQKLVDEAKERLSEPVGQELLNQRKVRSEEIFALAKELHGFRRTPFMGS